SSSPGRAPRPTSSRTVSTEAPPSTSSEPSSRVVICDTASAPSPVWVRPITASSTSLTVTSPATSPYSSTTSASEYCSSRRISSTFSAGVDSDTNSGSRRYLNRSNSASSRRSISDLTSRMPTTSASLPRYTGYRENGVARIAATVRQRLHLDEAPRVGPVATVHRIVSERGGAHHHGVLVEALGHVDPGDARPRRHHAGRGAVAHAQHAVHHVALVGTDHALL